MVSVGQELGRSSVGWSDVGSPCGCGCMVGPAGSSYHLLYSHIWCWKLGRLEQLKSLGYPSVHLYLYPGALQHGGCIPGLTSVWRRETPDCVSKEESRAWLSLGSHAALTSTSVYGLRRLQRRTSVQGRDVTPSSLWSCANLCWTHGSDIYSYGHLWKIQSIPFI